MAAGDNCGGDDGGGDAVARGLPPAERHVLREFRPDVRRARAAAKEDCEPHAKL